MDWQQRKARSFQISPVSFGFEDKNVRYTDLAKKTDLSMGTAIATSGAAVSPNMGYHTSTSISFILTIFNVRLGQWFSNPRRMKSRKEITHPSLSLFYLIFELFGLTKETSKNVYLSDGGHFENLGIYELVKRKCDLIVVSDASADKEFKFDDLGNAVEKCRVDLGVSIELDPELIKPDIQTGQSRRQFVKGKINYDNQKPGTIIYMKPSLSGDEPVDIQSYKEKSPSFPHQSTADQWFDESQFESYRALGYHIGKKAI